MDINNAKDTVNTKIKGLPFRGMLEKKVSPETRSKFPVLDKIIPFANYIACGLAAVILVVVIASVAGGGGSSGRRAPGRANSASDFSYDLTEDGKGILIKGYTGGPGWVVVPEKIEGYPVVEIGRGVFDGKTLTFSFARGTKPADVDVGSRANEKAGIIGIVLPNTVRKIGSSAFANTAITRFDMPDSVTEIGTSIFSGCNLLTEIKLSDNLELIEDLSLGGLPALKKMNLPKNLKRLHKYAFSGYKELTELIIPNTITEIEFGISSYGYEKPWSKIGERYWATANMITAEEMRSFSDCGKLPLKTRQRLKELGYTGGF